MDGGPEWKYFPAISWTVVSFLITAILRGIYKATCVVLVSIIDRLAGPQLPPCLFLSVEGFIHITIQNFTASDPEKEEIYTYISVRYARRFYCWKWTHACLLES